MIKKRIFTDKDENIEPWKIPKVEDVEAKYFVSGNSEATSALSAEQRLNQAYYEGYQAAKEKILSEIDRNIKKNQKNKIEKRKTELDELINLLSSPAEALYERIIDLQMELMITIIEHVCRKQFSHDHEILQKLTQEAMTLLPMQAKNIQLYLHPGDYEKISQYIMTEHLNAENIEFIADETLKPADFRIQSDIAKVDGRIKNRIATIVKKAFHNDYTV